MPLRRRSPLVLAGAALAGALALSGCTALFGGNVFTLSVGDCFDAMATENNEVSDVPTVDCSEPHDFEVIRAVNMEGSAYPGADALFEFADAECEAAFEAYTGRSYSDSGGLDYDYLYPTQGSWAVGDREVLCLVFDWDDVIVGSVKNIGPAA